MRGVAEQCAASGSPRFARAGNTIAPLASKILARSLRFSCKLGAGRQRSFADGMQASADERPRRFRDLNPSDNAYPGHGAKPWRNGDSLAKRAVTRHISWTQ